MLHFVNKVTTVGSPLLKALMAEQFGPSPGDCPEAVALWTVGEAHFRSQEASLGFAKSVKGLGCCSDDLMIGCVVDLGR